MMLVGDPPPTNATLWFLWTFYFSWQWLHLGPYCQITYISISFSVGIPEASLIAGVHLMSEYEIDGTYHQGKKRNFQVLRSADGSKC